MTWDYPSRSLFAGLRPVAVQDRETPFAADMLHRRMFLNPAAQTKRRSRFEKPSPSRGGLGGDGVES
jgi:hypothetical protein